MDNYDYLLEKAKRDGIEKNVVGAIIIIDELPSGNMEIGENISTALVREVKEETNCDMKDQKINFLLYP